LAKKEALIKGALAVAAVFANSKDPTLVSTYIQAGLVAAEAAAQYAVINAQKFEKGGRVGGKRHSAGGTLIEAEEGEFVINRKSYAKNKDVVEAINKGKFEAWKQKFIAPPALKINKVMSRSENSKIVLDTYKIENGIHKLTSQDKRSAQMIVDAIREASSQNPYTR
jgi:hypothetical protein